MRDLIYKFFGYRSEYISNYGTHSRIYDSSDLAALRPIHENMSVAPPWAIKVYIK